MWCHLRNPSPVGAMLMHSSQSVILLLLYTISCPRPVGLLDRLPKGLSVKTEGKSRMDLEQNVYIMIRFIL